MSEIGEVQEQQKLGPLKPAHVHSAPEIIEFRYNFNDIAMIQHKKYQLKLRPFSIPYYLPILKVQNPPFDNN